VPRVKYAMNYRPKNSFSMSYTSRKVIFPGVSTLTINSACKSCSKYRMSIQEASNPVLSYKIVLSGILSLSEVANWILSLKIKFRQMLYHSHNVIYPR